MSVRSNLNIKGMSTLFKVIAFLTLFPLVVTAPLVAKDYEGPLFGSTSTPGEPVTIFDVPGVPSHTTHGQVFVPHRGYYDSELVERFKNSPYAPPISQENMIEDASHQMASEPLAPSQIQNFGGIGYTGWVPPDPILAAGPNHILVMVNSSLAIFNKDGTKVSENTQENWFSNVLPGGGFTSDPKVIYDQYSGHWVMLVLYISNTFQKGYYLLSASETSDPTGLWWNWALDASLDGSKAINNWPDYPELGFDDKALYISSNQFNPGGSFKYVKIRILKKSQVYNGSSVSWTDLVKLTNPDGSLAFTVKPCTTFGTPPGVEYMVNSLSRLFQSSSVTLWKLTNPLSTPSLTRVAIPVKPYSIPPNARQLGTTTPIDTGDTRIMNAVYRNGSVWIGHNSGVNWGNGAEAALHFVQMSTSNNKVLFDSFYGGTGFDYYYPAVMVDSSGNMVTVFTRSGPTEYASIRYTGKLTGGTLIESSAQLKAGEGPYQPQGSGVTQRWGDYAGAWVDPSDDKTMWIFHEYAKTATPFNIWGTWIGSVQYAP